MKTKDRPREPPISKEMGENFLVKKIPTRLGVQPRMSGPAESSVSFVQLEVLAVLAPAIPQSGAVFSAAGVCGRKSKDGHGLGSGGGPRMGSSGLL